MHFSLRPNKPQAPESRRLLSQSPPAEQPNYSAGPTPNPADAVANVADDSILLETLLQISDRGLQTHGLAVIAGQRALCDPPQTANWLLGLPDSLDRADAFAQLGRAWAETDPQKAAEFALRLPSGALRQSGLTAALTVWLSHDLAAATAWLSNLDSHPDLDGITGAVATLPALIESRPDVALGWAESIVNDDDRKQRIGTIAAAWLARDRTAAANYLRNTPVLASFQRETLIEELGL